MNSITVELCAGTACHIMGANPLSNLLQSLEPEFNCVVKVKFVHCLGNCGHGPNVKIQGTLYSRVTSEKLLELIKHHCEQE